jgi:hypothetical protein
MKDENIDLRTLAHVKAYLEKLDFSGGDFPHDRDSLDDVLRDAFVAGYEAALADGEASIRRASRVLSEEAAVTEPKHATERECTVQWLYEQSRQASDNAHLTYLREDAVRHNARSAAFREAADRIKEGTHWREAGKDG